MDNGKLVTMSIRVPAPLHARLQAEARHQTALKRLAEPEAKKGVSISQVVVAALAERFGGRTT